MEGPSPQGNLKKCCANLVIMASGCERYNIDNGFYPASLKDLAPKYLENVPTCVSAKKDTYSEGYTQVNGGKGYLITCKGHNHADAGIQTDYPRFDSNRKCAQTAGE